MSREELGSTLNCDDDHVLAQCQRLAVSSSDAGKSASGVSGRHKGVTVGRGDRAKGPAGELSLAISRPSLPTGPTGFDLRAHGLSATRQRQFLRLPLLDNLNHPG